MSSLFGDAIEAHEKLVFPDFAEDDDFSDWMAELVEIDGYYVGLAMSNIGASNPRKINKSDLLELANRLAQFSSLEGDDSDVFHACETYIQSLLKVVDLANMKQK